MTNQAIPATSLSGPPVSRWFGFFPEFQQDSLDFLLRCHSYGDVVKLPMGRMAEFLFRLVDQAGKVGVGLIGALALQRSNCADIIALQTQPSGFRMLAAGKIAGPGNSIGLAARASRQSLTRCAMRSVSGAIRAGLDGGFLLIMHLRARPRLPEANHSPSRVIFALRLLAAAALLDKRAGAG